MKTLILLITALFFITNPANSHVALDYPLGGELFTSYEVVTIRWHEVIPHDAKNWDVFFSTDGGQNWDTIALDIPKNQLELRWIVPQNTSEYCRIKVVQDNPSYDYESTSTDFSVIAGGSASGIIQHEPGYFKSYPNPLLETNYYSFDLQKKEFILIELFNMAGIKHMTILNEELFSGSYEGSWDASGLANGAYILRIQVGSKSEKRLVIVNR